VSPIAGFTAFDRGPLTFGRSDQCSVRLEGQQVSRHHATAALRGSRWFLSDEGSKNGSFVDGVRVQDGLLSLQNVVRIGEWVGVVIALDAESAGQGIVTRQLAPRVYGGPTLAAAFQTLAAAARSDISVVLVGETGTGKEVFARALHKMSERAGSLVPVNCAALPQQMVEGELFGYRKGAFTGADRNHLGYLRAADGGTLFLDEILDLERMMQAKLLRVLEERAVSPLGETRARSIDLRVVAATQRPLHDAVERGEFRADLMARLTGLEVHIPSLRERREDVIELLRATSREELGAEAPKLSPDLVERLCNYDWPLNVREVVQVARRACALHGSVPLWTPEHIPTRIAGFVRHAPSRATSVGAVEHENSPRGSALEGKPLEGRASKRRARLREKDDQELEALIALLRECQGKVSEAAKRMGISRQRAYRLLDQRPELDVEELRQRNPGEPP
jgi:DNA-binding NtrC family response regulator